MFNRTNQSSFIDTKEEELTRSDEAEALIREKLNLACTTHLVEIL